MEQGYLAQIQALIDQKWKENPEEMKRVMAELEAKEKQKAKGETPKQVSFDPQLTQELIEELNKKYWDDVDMSKVQDLIEKGADVRVINCYGKTPLHRAIIEEKIEMIKLLLERGTDVNAKRNDGATPLHVASRFNRIEIAKFLLKAGADVDAKDKWEWTPLHWASIENSIETAELLIDAGADVETKNYDGWTPLDFAKSNVMKALLKKYQK